MWVISVLARKRIARRFSSIKTKVVGATFLSYSHQSLDRLDELLCIPPYTVFENDLDILDIADARGGIALYDHQIGLLTRGDRTYAGIFTQKFCSIQTVDLDRLERRKPCFDKKFNPAKISEPRHDPAVACGIEPGDQ